MKRLAASIALLSVACLLIAGDHNALFDRNEMFEPNLLIDSAGTVLDPTLRCWWKFDAGSELVDSSGNGNTLTTNSAPVFSGGYMTLDGTDDFAYTAAVSDDYMFAKAGTGDNPFTLTGWFWADAGSIGAANLTMLQVGESSVTEMEYNLFHRGASGNLAPSRYKNGTANRIRKIGGVLPEGEWVFVAMTCGTNVTSSTIALYTNGVAVSVSDDNAGTYSPGMNDENVAFKIGGTGAVFGFWKGRIDDVRVYAEEKTGGEVLAIYGEGRQ